MSLNPATEEVLRQLMELPAEERAEAAAALRASLEGTSWALKEPDLHTSYGAATEAVESNDQPTPEEEAELNRRMAAVRSGEVRMWSHEEAISEAYRSLAERRAASSTAA
jgi:uncharacterized protein YifE (UPF0438 family)